MINNDFTMDDDERLVPIGMPIYSKVLSPENQDDRTQHESGRSCRRRHRQQQVFYNGIYIQHPSPMYRWKVYIGDIVAISMADHQSNEHGCLSLQDIEDWHPDHLKRKSPHWKIGLVLAISQTVAIADPTSATTTTTTTSSSSEEHHVVCSTIDNSYECHVEWLEKALDTPEFLNHKKLVQSYRPYTKPSVPFKLPHLLLRSYSYSIVSPANILPVQITMLTDADFKGGVQWDPSQRPEDRFSFKMHCPKCISPAPPALTSGLTAATTTTTTTFPPDPCMDHWPELNHYSFVKKVVMSSSSSSKNSRKEPQQQQQQQWSKRIVVPQPLQMSWSKWAPIQDDDQLLTALMRGYEQSYSGKIQAYRTFKNRQVQEEQLRMMMEEEENASRPTQEAAATATAATATAESKANRSSSNNNKNKKKRGADIVPINSDTIDHSNNNNNNNNNKRVRVSIDGATPLVGPTKSKGNIHGDSNTVKSILKTHGNKGVGKSFKSTAASAPTTMKTTHHGKKTTGQPRVLQLESTVITATPSTKSLSSSFTTTPTVKSPSVLFHSLPHLNLSKTQRSMTITPGADTDGPIHTGIHQGERHSFYERVTMVTKDESNSPRVIVVGEIVAVVKEDKPALSTQQAQSPMNCPWGVAQVLALYQSMATGDWIMQLRWLLRFVETEESVQQQLRRKKYFDASQGLLETMDVSVSPIHAILSVNVDVASAAPRGKLLSKFPKPRMDDNELPTLYFQCRYLQEEDGSIVLKNDWDDVPTSSRISIRGSLARGLACMNLNRRVKDKYEQAIRDRLTNEMEYEDDVDDDDETDKLTEDKDSINTLLVEPLSEKPIFERWGFKFHDGVRVAIDSKALSSSFSPETTQWTVKVGYVVPVSYDTHGEAARPQKNAAKRWFPFICSWCAAQIVSIYEDDSGRWKMQIRWFDRFEDLHEEHREDLGNWNKPHILFETENYSDVDVACCLPGRVVLSSSNCDSWEVAKSSISGLPFIPRLCSHFCFDDQIDESSDWTNYDIQLPSYPRPLARGMLLDPCNRNHKDWILMLSRRYKKSLSLRCSDPEALLLKRWEGIGPAVPKGNIHNIGFCAGRVVANVGDVWYTHNRDDGKQLTFFQRLNVNIPIDYIAMPSKSIRKAKHLSSILYVGCVVAFHAPEAGERTDHIMMKQMKYPWFPFRVPWCYGQVVAIYSEHTGESSGPPVVEIRRFYRPSEIPPTLRPLMPSASEDAQREEIFESDSFVSSVPASCILGPCELFLGKHDCSFAGLAPSGGKFLLSCRSRFFYHETHGRFQQLFTTGFTPEAWWKRLYSRGISLSSFLGSSGEIQQRMLLACSEPEQTLDVCRLLGGPASVSLGARGKIRASDSSQLTFFSTATLFPKWEDVIDADIHFCKSDRVQTTWEIEIGSIVAVRSDMVDEQKSVTFPFRVSWIPCQIVAIYSNASAAVEDLCFEVIQLRFLNKHVPLHTHNVPNLGKLHGNSVSTIRCADLLGPVVLQAVESQEASFDWGDLQKGIPVALVRGTKLPLSEMKEAIAGSKSQLAEAIITTLGSIPNTCRQDRTQTHSSGGQTEKDDMVTTILTSPAFVDVAHRRVFYDECWLVPQVELFESWMNSKTMPQEAWSVRRGDVVVIHCDGPKKYPLKCNWGVAEIIAIWKEYETRDQLEKEVHTNGTNSKGNLKAEIRWFYERQDVAGLSGGESIDDSNEVFETDDTFILDDLTTIVAPANLYANHETAQPDSRKFLNFPIQTFLCHRFWSTSRRSLIPCGDLASRESRARLYSQIVPRSFPSKIPNNDGKDTHHGEKGTDCTHLTWGEAVQEVIAKLSLKETSKGAYDRGEALTGRENEMMELLAFFRAALRGLQGPGGVRSSIFLAGAPGVGKTACIRSAIVRLHLEQANGELPAFNFIPLNGMEMRHPYEAYVKLWEGLTGEKHIGSHEKACQRLENHFTNPKSLASDSDRSVTIVLLDEIDYLVTDKQSVLYNFFDWPRRAASIPGGRRLIVVGISNTLNLTEQLMPSVQSRVGSERIVFKAYGVAEATAILQKKIHEAAPNHMIFEKDAILFAAKKTAAMSGDIRKAFQICRGAAELLLRRGDEADKENAPHGEPFQGAVRISDVQKASRESFDSALVAAVSMSTQFQALLLVALASLRRSTGREVGGFDIMDIMTKMDSLSGSFGDPQYAPPPAFGETLHLLTRLAETNLIKLCTASSSTISFRSLGGGSGGAWPMTTLAVDEPTITRGLKGTPHQKLSDKFLPPLY